MSRDLLLSLLLPIPLVTCSVPADGDGLKWPRDFKWSPAGHDVPGMYCTQILPGIQYWGPQYWGDNHFCAHKDIGMKWSSSGPIGNMTCTEISEPTVPNWPDNYLCVPAESPLDLVWSYSGAVPGKLCIRWWESGAAWLNNFLCASCPKGSASRDSTCYCPSGMFWETPGYCMKCPLNTYSASEGSTECRECPANSTSVTGATTCTCVVGYVKENGTCSACPRDTFGNGIKCSACPAGYVSENGQLCHHTPDLQSHLITGLLVLTGGMMVTGISLSITLAIVRCCPKKSVPAVRFSNDVVGEKGVEGSARVSKHPHTCMDVGEDVGKEVWKDDGTYADAYGY